MDIFLTRFVFETVDFPKVQYKNMSRGLSMDIFLKMSQNKFILL